MFLIRLLIVCFLLVPAGVLAQNNDDSLIHIIIKKQIALNAQKQTYSGYRIQLYFGPQREKAYELRTEFIKLMTHYGAYVIYHQPNFKLRVGDFRTRLEAQKALLEIQSYYPSAFIVRDDIKIITDD